VFGFTLKRSGYNKKSLENLTQNRGAIGPSIDKEAAKEEAAVGSASRTALLIQQLNEANLLAYERMNKAIEEKAAILAARPTDETEPGMGELVLNVLEILGPHLAPYIGPYVGPALEKYGGIKPIVQPNPMPTAAGQPSAEVAPPSGASSRIKAALSLPDFVWTAENVQSVLAQHGLGDLSIEDLRKLGQKLSKVKANG